MLLPSIWIFVASMDWMFDKKWLRCRIVKSLLLFIQFLDWFCTCLGLYVVSFRFNYCRWYIRACFTRSNLFVWLWNDYYFISGYWLIFTCYDLYNVSFHLYYCNVYVIGSFKRSYYFVWWRNDYYHISSSMIDSLLNLICMLSLFN